MFTGLKKGLWGHCSRLDHFDNQFLTYTVMLHDWLNQPGYAALFTVSFLASTMLPLGSEWLPVALGKLARYAVTAFITLRAAG
jgi:membrane protein YqaA with SNARE-associated domain